MPYYPPDFDPNSSDFEQYGLDWNSIMPDYGFNTWADVIYPETRPDPRTGDGFRSQVFSDPSGALAYLYDAGILSHSLIWWDEENGGWCVYVDDTD